MRLSICLFTLLVLLVTGCTDSPVNLDSGKSKKVAKTTAASEITDAAAINDVVKAIKAKAETYKAPKASPGPRAPSLSRGMTDRSGQRQAKQKAREAFLWARDQLGIESLLPIGKLKEVPDFKKTISRQKAKKPVAGGIQAVIQSVRGAGPGGNYDEYYVSDSLSMDSYDYIDNMNYVYWGDFLAPANAAYIYLNFSWIDMESPYDHVYIYDYQGRQCDAVSGRNSSSFTTVYCNGNYAEVNVQSDSSISGEDGYDGFYISGYTYGIEQENHAPIAIAVADAYNKADGQQFLFVGDQSYDPDSGDYIAYWEWDFGDGYTSSSRNVYHTYAYPGYYNVSLTVWDTDGSYSTDYISVYVREVPNPVNFVNTFASAHNLRFSWDSGGSDTRGYVLNWTRGYAPSLDCYNGYDYDSSETANITGLDPLTQYTFALCAYNAYDRYSENIRLFISTPAIVYPPRPVSLSVSGLQPKQFTFNWSSGGGNTAGFYVAIAQGTIAPTCTNGVDVGFSTSRFYSGLHGNTTYSLSVCAYNADGDAGSSSTFQVTTPPLPLPPAPTGLNVSGLFSNRLTLNWGSGGGTTHSYNVAIAPGTVAPNCMSGTNVGAATSKLFSSLASETTYTMSVCALNDEGGVGPSVSFEATTPATPPPPPPVTGLVATSVGATSVSLSWESGGGSTVGYYVVHAKSPTPPVCNPALNLFKTESNHTFSGLTANSLYSFTICAANNVDAISAGVSIQVTTLDPTPAPNPTGLTISSKTFSSINLSWVSGGGVTQGFLVKYQAGSTAPANCTGGASIPTPGFSITGLNPYSTYAFRVCAVNKIGVATSGVTVSGQTFDEAPIQPTDLITISRTTTTITLGWNYAGTNVAGGFLVKGAVGLTPPTSCSAGFDVPLSARTSVRSGLTANTNYSYRLCAKNGNGVLTSGITISTRTLQTAPPNPTTLTSVVTASTVRLIWLSGGGNTASYLVASSPTSLPTNCSGGQSVTERTMTFSELAPFKTYYYRVCSVNADGASSAGITISPKTLDLAASNITNLALDSRTASSITLKWDYAGVNLGGGFVRRIVSGTVPPTSCTGGTEVTLASRSAAWTGLIANTNYAFRICSKNGNGVLTSGVTFTIRTLQTPPPNPTTLAATATHSSISLTWLSGGGSTASYLVSQSATGLPAANCAGGQSVVSRSFLADGLEEWKTYYFRVCSVNADGAPSAGITISKKTLANGITLGTAVPNYVAFNGGAGYQITPSTKKVSIGWGGGATSGVWNLFLATTSVQIADAPIANRTNKCADDEILMGKPAGAANGNYCAKLAAGYITKNHNFMTFNWWFNSSAKCTGNQVAVGSRVVTNGTTVTQGAQSFTCSYSNGCGITYCATVGN